MSDTKLACSCGAVEGVVKDLSPKKGNHLICHCSDCIAFAKFLDGEGKWLQENDGVAIFQTSPAAIEISTGLDKLAIVRLSEKGLHRTYASCCNTPIGNMLKPNVPFIGFLTDCLVATDAEKQTLLGRAKHVQVPEEYDAQYPPSERDTFFNVARKVIGMILWGMMKGDQKKSPFVDGEAKNFLPEISVLKKSSRNH